MLSTGIPLPTHKGSRGLRYLYFLRETYKNYFEKPTLKQKKRIKKKHILDLLLYTCFHIPPTSSPESMKVCLSRVFERRDGCSYSGGRNGFWVYI
jgi:hypothetical protein